MILIASSVPATLNSNLSIVSELAVGMEELCGAEQVKVVRFEAVIPTLEKERPSMLLMVGSPMSTAANYREISDACRSSRSCFVFWTVEDPYEFDYNERFTPFSDYVFTNEALAVPYYNRTDVFHLPLAAAARLRSDIQDLALRQHELFFCGVAFPNRQVLVSDLLPVIAGRRYLILGENWPSYGDRMVQNRRLPAAAIAYHYGQSLCVLNMGRNFSIANASNMQSATPGPRTFEAAMVGCIQLMHKPGPILKNYFEPGKEILVFDTVGEFQDMFEETLSDPNRFHCVAEAAQNRALAEHTYRHRAEEIMRRTGVGRPD